MRAIIEGFSRDIVLYSWKAEMSMCAHRSVNLISIIYLINCVYLEIIISPGAWKSRDYALRRRCAETFAALGVHVAPAALQPVLVELDELAVPQDAARELATLHLRATYGGGLGKDLGLRALQASSEALRLVVSKAAASSRSFAARCPLAALDALC